MIEDGDGNDLVAKTFYGPGFRTKAVTYYNGTSENFAYDGFRFVTDIDHKDSQSTTFAGFDYAYDKMGNPLYVYRSLTILNCVTIQGPPGTPGLGNTRIWLGTPGGGAVPNLPTFLRGGQPPARVQIYGPQENDDRQSTVGLNWTQYGAAVLDTTPASTLNPDELPELYVR